MTFEYRGCMLANHWTVWPAGLPFVIVEPKVDGYRLSAIVEQDLSVSFRCRDPEPPTWIEHLDHVALEISDLGLPPGTMVDGEVMAADWNETSKLLRTFRANMDDDDRQRIREEVKFHVFDLVDLTRLELRPPVGRQRKPRLVDPTPQAERTLAVRSLLERQTQRMALQRLPGAVCSNQEEVDAAYARFCRDYEGAIVKLPDEPYYFIRSDAWLKIKPQTTVELVLTGAIEGEGKHVGRLGALVGTLPSGLEARVGTGFDDAERTRLWAMRDRLPGLRAEITHQAGRVATARHPVYLRLRDLG